MKPGKQRLPRVSQSNTNQNGIVNLLVAIGNVQINMGHATVQCSSYRYLLG
jgi:hypothetical protein